jgi:hypothetical protein
MKKVMSAVVFLLVVTGIQPASAGGTYWQDGDYERICLTMGWSDCAVWKIVDSDGIEKNRVIGPGSITSLAQTCGPNFCGGGESATAIKLETLSPITTPSAIPASESSTVSTPTPTPTSEPAPSRIPYTQPCVGGSDRTPGLPQCLMPEGIGGSAWNLVDDSSGIVINGAICSEAVCGRNGEWRQWPATRLLNDRLWPNGYPEGATYIQTPFDHAYWGRYYTNGVYEVSGGGILQPGSSTIIWPIREEAPLTQMPPVRSETSTPSAVTETATVAASTNPITLPTSGSPSSPATEPSSGRSAEATSTALSTLESTTPTIPVTTIPTAVSPADSDLSSLDEIAPEEEIIDSIDAIVQSNGTTRIEVSTGWNSTAMRVVASKKGVKKKYTYKITTNSVGERKFRAGLNLRGYTLVLLKGSTELDRIVVS